MKKQKISTTKLADLLTVLLLIIIILFTLIECIKTRREISRYVDFITEVEDCQTDTSLV